jgi:uncharacterized protein (TIGR00730 family)
MLNQIKTICVFSGSSSGSRDIYREKAKELGMEISKKKLSLVYGGGNIGLMKAAAEGALSGGSVVTGVIPELIAEKVKSLKGVKTITVPSMHERKALMYKLSDAFIALPGGTGTLEELIEVITWNQLGYHLKPVGILNTAGYYDSLVKLFEKAVEEGFFKKVHMEAIVIEENPEKLLKKVLNKELTFVDKWEKK